ncbi:9609_t:CDS:2, partial [Funneliformis geosporum]
MPIKAILEVWNIRATGTHGIRHYVILLNEGMHLCTCLLLINKGLIDSCDTQPSQSAVNLPKAMYVELTGLSKKVIDCALKSNKQQELLNIFKAFIYDVKNRLELENSTDIINPIVIMHKGQPPKRLMARVLNREKQILKDISKGNIIEDNNASNIIEDSTNNTKGQKCSK